MFLVQVQGGLLGWGKESAVRSVETAEKPWNLQKKRNIGESHWENEEISRIKSHFLARNHYQSL